MPANLIDPADRCTACGGTGFEGDGPRKHHPCRACDGYGLIKAEVVSADQVTDELLDDVWSVIEGWYLGTSIDWEDVLNRVERFSKWDFGTYSESAAIRKIQRIMRERKREVACDTSNIEVEEVAPVVETVDLIGALETKQAGL